MEIKNNSMETIHLEQEVKVFGVQVKTFPMGIGEAFDQLIKMLPGGFSRSFYGQQWSNDLYSGCRRRI